MTLCFALTLMALPCWENCLVEMMREYTSLSLPIIDVDGFIMWMQSLFIPTVSCLILIINTASISWELCNLELSYVRENRRRNTYIC